MPPEQNTSSHRSTSIDAQPAAHTRAGASSRSCSCSCSDIQPDPQDFVDALVDLNEPLEKCQSPSCPLLWRNETWNSLLPACRLPPELLEAIFSLCVPRLTWATSSEAVWGPRRKSSLSWIAFSHVCHKWRAVALECPTLWTHPPFSYPEMAYEMLARAKGRLLHIAADIKDATGDLADDLERDPARRALFFALRQTARIQNLHLEMRWPYLRDQFSSILSPPARNMETLRIWTYGFDQHDELTPYNVYQVAPGLRRLLLCNCPFDWTAPALRNLVFLKLSDFNSWGEYMSTWDGILAGLQAMRALVSLVLEHVLPPHDPPPFQGREIVLHSLRALHVANRVPALVALLQRLRLDAVPHLQIRVFPYPGDPDPALPTGLVPAANTALKNALLIGDAPCSLQIAVEQSNLMLETWSTADMRGLPRLRLPINVGLRPVAHALAFLEDRRWLASVHRLRVDLADFPSVLDDADWGRVLAALPAVRTLTAVGPACGAVLEALAQNATVLPALETVTLMDNERTLEGVSSWQARLDGAFGHRSVHRAPLAELRLVGHLAGAVGAAVEGVTMVVCMEDGAAEIAAGVWNGDWDALPL